MSAITALATSEKSTVLAPLVAAGWKLQPKDSNTPKEALTKTFHFSDFNEAFGFMTRVAIAAEKADHHPEWFNVYNRVEVLLTTHDAGNSVSKRDVDLATKMEEFASTQRK
ncbi:hypothetical protein HDU79_004951 [Rhizoclosmatium sp. JEL0117]|nr:hypothetical protein HDU79_004951 [Rhizoclosmatium sp. JEL0117]